MICVHAPSLPVNTHEAWVAVFELARAVPDGWTVIGGQMAQLHAWQRRRPSPRTTHDVDAGLDLRGRPNIAVTTTAHLREAGFTAQSTATDGAAVRWTRSMAEIDVLVPASLGREVKDVNDDSMLASHGIQQALDRSEAVSLTLADGTAGTIRRPNLFGAVIAKCAAFANASDTRADRHADDLMFLLSMVEQADVERIHVTSRDLQHLERALDESAIRAVLVDESSPERVALGLIAAAAEASRHHREVARHERRGGLVGCSICGRPFDISGGARNLACVAQ